MGAAALGGIRRGEKRRNQVPLFVGEVHGIIKLILSKKNEERMETNSSKNCK